MQTNPDLTEEAQPIVAGKTAFIRLAVGLAQGAILYLLYLSAEKMAWPATQLQLFMALLLASLFGPLLLISSLGHLPVKRIWIWAITAMVIAGTLGFYDVWRQDLIIDVTAKGERFFDRFFNPLVFIFTGIGLFIAHVLILAAARDQRLFAKYTSYFDIAWKLAIQIIFAGAFVGVLWMVLGLGAALFMLIKLEFLKELLQKPWFSIPLSACALSFAFHMTDVRSGIVHGIRTLLLVLMSWLLPLATFIIACFLFSLPFTGLEPLWATGHASALLLAAAAALVVLINAAFQAGETQSAIAGVVRLSARVACLLLLPLVAITFYSLALRVSQYGWTVDRIIAAACVVVASCYAIGYLWAAIKSPTWLSRIAPTNIFAACVILALLLALFTPIADPVRLAVASQVHRLEAGKISPEKFDFAYLKHSGERYGKQALQKLISGSYGANTALIKQKAEQALRLDKYSRDIAPTSSELGSNITVLPKTAVLPESFLKQNWQQNKEQSWMVPRCLRSSTEKCNANLIDFHGDAKMEILLTEAQSHQATLFKEENGTWKLAGTLTGPTIACAASKDALAKGMYRTVPSLMNDLELNGRRMHVTPPYDNTPCEPEKKKP